MNNWPGLPSRKAERQQAYDLLCTAGKLAGIGKADVCTTGTLAGVLLEGCQFFVWVGSEMVPSGKGLGVVALESIPAGSFVMEYKGERQSICIRLSSLGFDTAQHSIAETKEASASFWKV